MGAVIELDDCEHLQILDDDPVDTRVRDPLEGRPEGAAALLGVGPDERQDGNLRPDLAVGAGGEKALVKFPLICPYRRLTLSV